uniref:Uncharacterized protein n=1 Tax=Medicago truncatula TaxID=3880 RepID=A2Q4G3_MEDTR|nr:hypothetical protein MtrDRAFT_AC157473g31v2 [Medicago truncatula]
MFSVTGDKAKTKIQGLSPSSTCTVIFISSEEADQWRPESSEVREISRRRA